jgi:hypothetical protein
MSEPKDRVKWRRILLAILIGGVVLAAVALSTVGLVASQRASNERSASTALKALASAEADFRANDRDWNGVNDFWTADVKGLYTMTAANIPGSADASIKLIELEAAAADADANFYPAGGENVPLSRFAISASAAGYWYHALLMDLTLKGGKEATYRTVTTGKPAMGAVHHESKFGFVAFPDRSSAGKYVFRVNENNTIFRDALTGAPRTGNTAPPGTQSIPPGWLHWPDDEMLKTYWSKDDCEE